MTAKQISEAISVLIFTKIPGISEDASFTTEDIETRETRDATKNFAHPMREGGKFGSHSIHDDHGDESTSD